MELQLRYGLKVIGVMSHQAFVVPNMGEHAR
jgi:hypothetical protein